MRSGTPSSLQPGRVAVIGAGLAGLTAAHELLDAGWQVSVFERREGPGLETSERNGSLQHPSAAEPWNSPGILRVLLANLGREDAAVLLRLRALPSLLGWGWRFVRESNPSSFFARTVANIALARFSVAQMARYRALGLDYHHRSGGTLVLHRDAAGLAEARRWAERIAAHGVASRVLDMTEALALEPSVAPIAGQLAGAVHFPDDELGDPLAFCTALAQSLRERGAALHFGADIARIEIAQGRVAAVAASDGSRHPADAVVLAAASASVALARPLGLALPVRPVKGYSITLPWNDAMPTRAIGDPSLHVAVVPVGQDRLRVAGTAEFTGFDLTLNPKRVANLVSLLGRMFPRAVEALPPDVVQPWTALRPMCADGLALVGATRLPGLWLHTGHGHLGWTQGAGSARLLADAMTGRASEIDRSPYEPARFGL